MLQTQAWAWSVPPRPWGRPPFLNLLGAVVQQGSPPPLWGGSGRPSAAHSGLIPEWFLCHARGESRDEGTRSLGVTWPLIKEPGATPGKGDGREAGLKNGWARRLGTAAGGKFGASDRDVGPLQPPMLASRLHDVRLAPPSSRDVRRM